MVTITDSVAWSVYQSQQSTRENVQKMGGQAAQIGDAALLAENARLALAGGAIAQHLGDMISNAATPEQLAAAWAVYRPVVDAFNRSINALMLRMMAAPKVAAAVSYTSVPVPVATPAQVAQVASIRVAEPQPVQVVGGTVLLPGAGFTAVDSPAMIGLVGIPQQAAAVAPTTGAQNLIMAGVVLKLLSLLL